MERTANDIKSAENLTILKGILKTKARIVNLGYVYTQTVISSSYCKLSIRFRNIYVYFTLIYLLYRFRLVYSIYCKLDLKNRYEKGDTHTRTLWLKSECFLIFLQIQP